MFLHDSFRTRTTFNNTQDSIDHNIKTYIIYPSRSKYTPRSIHRITLQQTKLYPQAPILE